MWHSLRFRLVVMFMLVVLVAVGTVALLASQATVNDLHIYTQAEGDQQLISTMLNAYTQHESQAALQKLAEQLARSSHRRIVLVDHQRRVLADSEGKLIGQVLPFSRVGMDLRRLERLSESLLKWHYLGRS
jgi:two-component system OmpR family sensor kinase